MSYMELLGPTSLGISIKTCQFLRVFEIFFRVLGL